jgi:hypothetical protein
MCRVVKDVSMFLKGHCTTHNDLGEAISFFCRFSAVSIFFLYKDPYEDFLFIFHVSLPNEVAFEDA